MEHKSSLTPHFAEFSLKQKSICTLLLLNRVINYVSSHSWLWVAYFCESRPRLILLHTQVNDCALCRSSKSQFLLQVHSILSLSNVTIEYFHTVYWRFWILTSFVKWSVGWHFMRWDEIRRFGLLCRINKYCDIYTQW